MKILTKMASDIADASDRHQLSDLLESLEAINQELNDNTSDAEFAMFNKCEADAATASRFLADEYAEEEREQQSDEMRFASYQSQR